MKKLLASLLVVALCMGIIPLSLAEAGSDLPYYEVKVLTTVSTNIQKSDETPIGQYIKDKFNIVFDFVPYTGDYKEKCNLMLAGSDYPEIVRLEYNEMVMKYADAGVLIDLEPYIAESENFKTRYAEQLPYFRQASGLGKAFSWQSDVPNTMEVKAEFNDVLVRTDALEAQGWPHLLSVSDYMAFIEKALEICPETNGMPTIGLTGPMGETWGLTGVIGQMYDKSSPYIQTAGMRSFIWNEVEEKFEYRFLNKEVQDNIRFFNQLYQKGYLDPDFFTDKGTQTEAKMSQGLPIVVWYSVWLMDAANTRLADAGMEDLSYIKMPIRSDEQAARGDKRLARNVVTRPYDSYAITDKAVDPDRLFALIDWACSDEGQILLQSGIEGIHYEYVDGKRIPTDEYVEKCNDADWRYAQGFDLMLFLGRFNTIAMDGTAYDLRNDPYWRDQLNLNDRQKEALAALGWENSNQWWFENSITTAHSLPSSVEIDPQSSLGLLQQKMLEHWTKAAAALVVAPTDEEFDALLAQAEEEFWALDPDRVLEEATRLYQEAKESLDALDY